MLHTRFSWLHGFKGSPKTHSPTQITLWANSFPIQTGWSQIFWYLQFPWLVYIPQRKPNDPQIYECLDSMVRWMEEILHQFIGGLSHYFQAFYHPRWCRISSIHSIITLPHPAGAEAHVLHCPRSRGRQPHGWDRRLSDGPGAYRCQQPVLGVVLGPGPFLVDSPMGHEQKHRLRKT